MVPWWTLLLVAFVAYVIGGWRRMRQNVSLRTDLKLAVEGSRAAALAQAGHMLVMLGADDERGLRAISAADDGGHIDDLDHRGADIIRATLDGGRVDRLGGFDVTPAVPGSRRGLGSGGQGVERRYQPLAPPEPLG